MFLWLLVYICFLYKEAQGAMNSPGIEMHVLSFYL